MQPGDRPLNDPAEGAQARPVRLATLGDRGPDAALPLSFRPSSIRFSGHPVPAEGSAFVTSGSPALLLGLYGVSLFRTFQLRPGWDAPYTPRPMVI